MIFISLFLLFLFYAAYKRYCYSHKVRQRNYTHLIYDYVANGVTDEEFSAYFTKCAHVDDACDTLGHAAIHIAILSYNLGMVKKVLELGGDINLKTKNSLTPLMFAAIKNRITILDYLLAHGADTSITNDAGQNALDMAYQYQQWEAVSHLKSHEFNKLNPVIQPDCKTAVL